MKIRYAFFAGLLVLLVLACKTTPADTGPASLADGSDSGPAAAPAADPAEARARAEAKLEELVSVREEAAAAGIQDDDKLPDRFSGVDQQAASARDQFDGGNYDGAFTDASEAAGRYRVLKAIADAHNLKKEADEWNFLDYDRENYEAACDSGNSAVELFDDGFLEEALTNADQAAAGFALVLENGWIAYTNEKSAAAQSWRQAALEARANVASRDMYEEADKIYNQAFASLRSGELEDAAGFFEQSGDLFKDSRDDAVEKRVRAEEAIRQAEQKVSQSGENVKNAGEILGDKE